MKKNVLQTQERGATLLEVMGVLAILSVISMGALSGYSQVMEMYSGAKGVTETRRILKDVDSYCAFERPCTITTEKAHKLKIIADEYYEAATKKTFSPFGADYSFSLNHGIGDGTTGCVGCPYYTFQHSALPVKLCVELMTADWNEDVYTRLFQFRIENRRYLFNEIKNYKCEEASGCYFFPMDLSDATTLCSTIWTNREEGEESYPFQWYFI